MTAFATGARRSAGAVAAAAWLGLLSAVVVGLHRLGHGPLATPPLLHPHALPTWVAQRDAPTAMFAVVRLLALALVWYLLASTALGALARASQVPRLVAAADLVTLPPIRRLLSAAAGAGLSLSLSGIALVPALGAALPGSHRPDAASARPAAGPAAAAGAPIVLQRLPDRSGVVLERLPDDDDTATMSVEPASTAPAPAPAWWTVQPGDSFWGQAERIVRAGSAGASDAEVTSYWLALIEHNRGRLVDPTNPDLIYPGQRFELPPP